MIIKIPKENAIYLEIETGDLYLYKGWHVKLRGHMLVHHDGPYVTYLATVHDEFVKSYFYVGQL